MKKELTKQQIRKQEKLLKRKEERKAKILNKKLFKEKYAEWVLKVKTRDNFTCQISGKYLGDSDPRALQACHILSKENYPELMFDEMNGISLSFYYHKNAPISSHLDGFAFTIWLKENKPEQYNYLVQKLKEHEEAKKLKA